jgi:2-methylcitrate dehydratase PrpD
MRFKAFHFAQATIAGIETAHMIRKGQLSVCRYTWSGESLFLRKLVLGIPAQASGKNLTRPPMPSAPRFVLVTSSRPLSGINKLPANSFAENPGNVALAK